MTLSVLFTYLFLSAIDIVLIYMYGHFHKNFTISGYWQFSIIIVSKIVLYSYVFDKSIPVTDDWAMSSGLCVDKDTPLSSELSNSRFLLIFERILDSTYLFIRSQYLFCHQPLSHIDEISNKNFFRWA